MKKGVNKIATAWYGAYVTTYEVGGRIEALWIAHNMTLLPRRDVERLQKRVEKAKLLLDGSERKVVEAVQGDRRASRYVRETLREALRLVRAARTGARRLERAARIG